MIREALNTYVGATALTVDFVSKPQSFLKRAQRKGSQLTGKAERQIRSFTKDYGRTVEELRSNPLSFLGLSNGRPAAAPKATTASKPRRARSARAGKRSTLTAIPSTTALVAPSDSVAS